MASLQQLTGGTFYICFRFGGARYKRSLRTRDRRKAFAMKARLDDTMDLVEQGRIELPDSVDVPTFLLSDGKRRGQTVVKEARLGKLVEQYFEEMPNGHLEPSTINMMQIHKRHLLRELTPRYILRTLSYSDLQQYVTKRSAAKGSRGRSLNASTIRKEVVTLRGLWNWDATAGHIPSIDFPSKGLRYPKTVETPPFQTFEEVTKLTHGMDEDSAEFADLWSNVFLSSKEIEELLDHVQANARHAFIYPMFVFAAHTGARRSEIIRSQMTDVGTQTITIRERKRKKKQSSTRKVPMSPRLRGALDEWFDKKPDSPFTICHANRSSCHSQPGEPISINESCRHLQFTLRDSKFQHLRGWHVFRHSFCSNCASKGIDQRIIDSWVGHTTEEMRKRYRHLFPKSERDALMQVFGVRGRVRLLKCHRGTDGGISSRLG